MEPEPRRRGTSPGHHAHCPGRRSGRHPSSGERVSWPSCKRSWCDPGEPSDLAGDYCRPADGKRRREGAHEPERVQTRACFGRYRGCSRRVRVLGRRAAAWGGWRGCRTRLLPARRRRRPRPVRTTGARPDAAHSVPRTRHHTAHRRHAPRYVEMILVLLLVSTALGFRSRRSDVALAPAPTLGVRSKLSPVIQPPMPSRSSGSGQGRADSRAVSAGAPTAASSTSRTARGGSFVAMVAAGREAVASLLGRRARARSRSAPPPPRAMSPDRSSPSAADTPRTDGADPLDDADRRPY